jgi:hypothetical protein
MTTKGGIRAIVLYLDVRKGGDGSRIQKEKEEPGNGYFEEELVGHSSAITAYRKYW